LYEVEVELGRNCLKNSDLSLLDIYKTLENDAASLEKFCIALIKAEDTLSVNQEFNPLESSEDEDEDEDEDESYVGHSQTFLLTFAILFLLLRDRRSHLKIYLMKSRQPNAKNISMLLRWCLNPPHEFSLLLLKPQL